MLRTKYLSKFCPILSAIAVPLYYEFKLIIYSLRLVNVVEKTKDYEVIHHTTFVINIGYKYILRWKLYMKMLNVARLVYQIMYDLVLHQAIKAE
jgi:hypothetical protein